MELILWNARGIRGKKAELTGKINSFDIICITETKLNKNYNLRFTGYATYRGDREKDQRIVAGGTAIMVKKKLKHKIEKNKGRPD